MINFTIEMLQNLGLLCAGLTNIIQAARIRRLEERI